MIESKVELNKRKIRNGQRKHIEKSQAQMWDKLNASSEDEDETLSFTGFSNLAMDAYKEYKGPLDKKLKEMIQRGVPDNYFNNKEQPVKLTQEEINHLNKSAAEVKARHHNLPLMTAEESKAKIDAIKEKEE